jgi:hypothetical protein
VNLNAFLAQLTNKSDVWHPRDPFNLSTFALWALRGGLEENDESQAEDHVALRAAAVWMIYAAARIWEASSGGLDLDGHSGRGGTLYHGRHWKGFNKERWNVWKKTFIESRSKLEDDSETQQLVFLAIEEMKGVDEE